jgi:hypothetical protein
MRRMPKETPTPIAALSPIERPVGDGNGEVVGFEVTPAVEGLLDWGGEIF